MLPKAFSLSKVPQDSKSRAPKLPLRLNWWAFGFTEEIESTRNGAKGDVDEEK